METILMYKITHLFYLYTTPKGLLAKMMQFRESAIDSGSEIRIKVVVESGGPKLKSILVNPNPYPNKDCRMLLRA